MSAVSKNLKRIRQAKGMTQDQLADALHVTRQAVSSWETGRSEPDIETLLALAEALGTNADELIYGPKAPQYAPMQRKYKICCIVFSLTCLAGFAARIWLRPWLIAYKGRTFDSRPYWIYLTALIPLFYAAGGALLGSLLSLGVDLRLSKLDDNRFVQFYGNTSEGKTILCVGQNYMKLSVYQPYREKCYILEKPLDMDYVLSLS